MKQRNLNRIAIHMLNHKIDLRFVVIRPARWQESVAF